MKVEEINPPPPEKLVVLTLTVEEAAFIREFARYYNVSTAGVTVAASATAGRCRDKLVEYTGLWNYPYDKAFQ